MSGTLKLRTFSQLQVNPERFVNNFSRWLNEDGTNLDEIRTQKRSNAVASIEEAQNLLNTLTQGADNNVIDALLRLGRDIAFSVAMKSAALDPDTQYRAKKALITAYKAGDEATIATVKDRFERITADIGLVFNYDPIDAALWFEEQLGRNADLGVNASMIAGSTYWKSEAAIEYGTSSTASTVISDYRNAAVSGSPGWKDIRAFTLATAEQSVLQSLSLGIDTDQASLATIEDLVDIRRHLGMTQTVSDVEITQLHEEVQQQVGAAVEKHEKMEEARQNIRSAIRPMGFSDDKLVETVTEEQQFMYDFRKQAIEAGLVSDATVRIKDMKPTVSIGNDMMTQINSSLSEWGLNAVNRVQLNHLYFGRFDDFVSERKSGNSDFDYENVDAIFQAMGDVLGIEDNTLAAYGQEARRIIEQAVEFGE